MTEPLPCGQESPAKLPPGSSYDRHLIVARHALGANDHTSRCLILLQVFKPDGSSWGPEIALDAATVGGLFHPAIAALAEGRFVLAWQEPISSDLAPQLALRVQVFNADGSPWEPAR